MNNMNQGNNLIALGQQTKISGLNNVLGAQTSIFNSNQGSNNAIWGAVGNIAGSWIGSKVGKSSGDA
jgi:hypothetical protein